MNSASLVSSLKSRVICWIKNYLEKTVSATIPRCVSAVRPRTLYTHTTRH